MRSLIALRGAFRHQWRVIATPWEFAFVVGNTASAAAGLAWVASTSRRPTVLVTVACGVLLMVTWRASSFRLGWLMLEANTQGALPLELISGSPLLATMLGKLAATALFCTLVGTFVFACVVAGAGRMLAIANPIGLLVSFAVALVAIMTTAFLLGPLALLGGGRPGFLNALMPIGVILSGFVQPVDLLPSWLAPLTAALATSWSTDALYIAVTVPGMTARLATDWAITLALCAVNLVVTQWLFVLIERRVRRDGVAP